MKIKRSIIKEVVKRAYHVLQEQEDVTAGLAPSGGKVTGDEATDQKLFDFFKEYLPGGSKHGEDPELCNLDVPNTRLMCQDNKGLARSGMPQLKTKDDEDLAATFVAWLEEKGLATVGTTTAPAASLKATQNQLKGAKVNGMNSALVKTNGTAEGIRAPIIVSSDGYVLDGHHRWASQVAYDFVNGKPPVEVAIHKTSLPIEDLLKLTKHDGEFCTQYGCVAPQGR